jgi:hypothetical protein
VWGAAAAAAAPRHLGAGARALGDRVERRARRERVAGHDDPEPGSSSRSVQMLRSVTPRASLDGPLPLGLAWCSGERGNELPVRR